MTTVYTRTTTAAGASNQNAPLTNAQVDANFINLNADKAPLTGEGTSGTWGISITGNAATATNVAYSGLTGAVPTWNQNTTGNAATATKLATARTINGVNFDGSANITVADATKAPLNGTGTSGTWPISITGNAAAAPWTGITGKPTVIAAGATAADARTAINLGNVDNTTDASKSVLCATKLTTARTINGVSFDGTANITVADATKLPLTGGTLTGELISSAADTFRVTQGGYGVFWRNDGTNTYLLVTASGDPNGTYTAARPLSMVNATGVASINGNAGTATKLATARTLTIGATGKSFDGSAAVTWTLAEIGAGDVTLTGTQTLTNKTLTTPLITGTREVRVAMPANAIDLATGNLFTKTISGATTLTVSNVPATGTAASFILELTNAGSAAITWFSGVKWAGGTAPTLTAFGVDVLGFYSHNGGTTWRGMLLAKDSK